MRNLCRVTGLLAVLVSPCNADDLSFTVTNIGEPVGQLMWQLYDSPESYANSVQPVISAKSRVDGDSLRVTLHDLAPGPYAIRLFHDANGNDELDTNILGIPTEGYGFSNDAGRFGPPSFEEAAIHVDGNTIVEMKVR